MKKIINDPSDALTDALAGFVAAAPELVAQGDTGRFIVRAKNRKQDKVALISGGGSGHEPMHGGFVGYGMLDAACPGEVFTSPTPDQMVAAAEAVDNGRGVLFIVKNYAGDVMNFEMAAEIYSGEVATVVTDDDVALGVTNDQTVGARGVAGTIIVEKIAGAAAEAGATLSECADIATSTNASIGSMAVALTSCTVPAAGKPTFSLAGDEIELGVGIHGEPGRERTVMKSADELADLFVASILEKLDSVKASDSLLVLCNGLGGTPMLELFILYHSAKQALDKRGLTISRSLVGNYCTSLDMAGASLTIAKLNEEQLKLWDAPADTFSFRQGDLV